MHDAELLSLNTFEREVREELYDTYLFVCKNRIDRHRYMYETVTRKHNILCISIDFKIILLPASFCWMSDFTPLPTSG